MAAALDERLACAAAGVALRRRHETCEGTYGYMSELYMSKGIYNDRA